MQVDIDDYIDVKILLVVVVFLSKLISRRIRRYRHEIMTTSVVYKGKLMLIRYR